MSTVGMWNKLKDAGVTFWKGVDSMWNAEYAGQRIGRKLYLGDAVWQAAEALGE